MHVGYIGLGVMGGALARRLLKAMPLTVWDINEAAVAEFAQLGAAVAPSAAELARRCDLVLLCLPRSSDVRQLLFRAGGLAEGLGPGKLVLDQTSGNPAETRAIAAEVASTGAVMFDAPVSGGAKGAAAGTIAIMTAGPQEAFERARPVLEAISPNVFRCGGTVGDAQAMKSLNNAMSAGSRLAAAETLALGRRMGLSLRCMNEIFNKGSARSRSTETMILPMIEGRSATDIALALMLKDLNQAVSLGTSCGAPTPLTAVVRGLLQAGVNLLGEGARYEEIIGLIARMAGTRFDPEPGAEPAPAPGSASAAAGLRVGYVGLGAMGAAIAGRLLQTRPLAVFDVDRGRARALEARGARVAPDLASLARECDVVMICVPTSTEVRAAIFGPGGLADGLSPGKIVVDQTSGDPVQTHAMATELASRGVALVDAAVAGGVHGAHAGTLAILCGGDPAAYAKVAPVLGAISPNSVYCGASGNGHVAKILNNALVFTNRAIVYEAASLGVRHGLALADIDRIINTSTGRSGASERVLPALARHAPTTDFRLELLIKDLRLAAELAAQCGAPMTLAAAARGIYQQGANQLGKDSNVDAMARLYEQMTGIEFSKVKVAD